METVLVLSVRCYSFKDEATGRQVQGTSIVYVVPDIERNADYRGVSPIKTSTSDKALFDRMSHVPGLYTLETRTRPGAGGKATVQLVGAQYVGEPGGAAWHELFEATVPAIREVRQG